MLGTLLPNVNLSGVAIGVSIRLQNTEHVSSSIEVVSSFSGLNLKVIAHKRLRLDFVQILARMCGRVVVSLGMSVQCLRELV